MKKGRPPKDPRLKMDTDLRIPLTAEQKETLQRATRDEPDGMAAWARDVLLKAAKKLLAKKGE
jgi:hypothetical protein